MTKTDISDFITTLQILALRLLRRSGRINMDLLKRPPPNCLQMDSSQLQTLNSTPTVSINGTDIYIAAQIHRLMTGDLV